MVGDANISVLGGIFSVKTFCPWISSCEGSGLRSNSWDENMGRLWRKKHMARYHHFAIIIPHANQAFSIVVSALPPNQRKSKVGSTTIDCRLLRDQDTHGVSPIVHFRRRQPITATALAPLLNRRAPPSREQYQPRASS
jgi:hypothetical protein